MMAETGHVTGFGHAELSDEQLARYARHVVLPEVGEEGQARLLAARVLVIGVGGLGSPLLLYLAAAGVGTLGVVDDDRVDVSNLQRQVLHATERIGLPKVESAKAALGGVNPEVRIETHALRLTAENARALVGEYDLVADGSDNFATRYALNDACLAARKPLVAASLAPFDGQLSTWKGWLPEAPCYRCLFRAPPPPELVPRCETAGILGAVAGVMGTLQATEVLKELLGIGDGLAGSLLLYDALHASFHRVRIAKDPDCPACASLQP